MKITFNSARSTRVVFSTLLLLLSFGAVAGRAIATPASPNPAPIIVAETLTAEQWRARGDNRSSEDVKGAIEDYTQAIQLAPNEMDYYHARARAYLSNNDKARALADLNQAIKVQPNSPSAYGERAIFYCAAGDRKNAIADWNQTVKMLPVAVTFSQRADCLVTLGDHKAAIADLDQAIKLNSSSGFFGFLYNQRALAKRSLGQKQAALEDFKTAAKKYGSGAEYDEIMQSIKELQ